ncbi:MAG: leucine-rich repeat domain-containing protein [Oscillospiraceae bacterium]|nr:leucine-rich repeat domain-containing protein [Oscillospiraceae bacterium]
MNLKKPAALLLAAVSACLLLSGCGSLKKLEGKSLTKEELLSGYQTSEARFIKSVALHDIRYNLYEDHAELIGFLSTYNTAVLTVPRVVENKTVTAINPKGYIPDCLDSVTFEDCVTSIGDEAFRGFTSLRAVTIPESVSHIGAHAFEDTTWMTAKQSEDPLVVVNSILINGQKAAGEVSVRSGVTCIADGAFEGNKTITGVSLPGSVYVIGNSAFSGCKGMAKLRFGMDPSLVMIGDGAFSYTPLTTIKLPAKVETLGAGAFAGCDELARVDLPGALTSIGETAFYNCASLKTIELPMNVSSIGKLAFYGCNDLTSAFVFNRECDICTSDDTFGSNPDLVLYGRKDSTAQAYATACGYTFIAY